MKLDLSEPNNTSEKWVAGLRKELSTGESLIIEEKKKEMFICFHFVSVPRSRSSTLDNPYLADTQRHLSSKISDTPIITTESSIPDQIPGLIGTLGIQRT